MIKGVPGHGDITPEQGEMLESFVEHLLGETPQPSREAALSESPPINGLEEIRQREKKATPGPWEVFEGVIPRVVDGNQYGVLMDEDDADFIAHAREDIPWLLGRDASARVIIGQLEARVTELEGQLAAAPCWCNDCGTGKADDHGIVCKNSASEYFNEYVGTYDSCEQCRRRGPKED